MIERFELPRELLSRLPILSEYLHNRDQTLANGFTYQQLLDEMDSAIGAIDSRQLSSAGYSGQCWVHPQAKIDENVVMEGPCIVCRGAVVGPKAYLGPGTVVGPDALLSFGVKVKATVVGAKSKIRHRTFVANSIIGESTDITETLIVSSTQSDHSPVKSWTMTGRPLQTNLTQLGSHIGTRAKLGANTLVMPGSVLCDDISVGNTVVNGYVTSHGDSQPWDSRLKAIKSLVRSLYRQHDLFWQQSQLFLTLSGFLFAAVVFMSSISAPSDSATGIGFLAFGLIELASGMPGRQGRIQEPGRDRETEAGHRRRDEHLVRKRVRQAARIGSLANQCPVGHADHCFPVSAPVVVPGDMGNRRCGQRRVRLRGPSADSPAARPGGYPIFPESRSRCRHAGRARITECWTSPTCAATPGTPHRSGLAWIHGPGRRSGKPFQSGRSGNDVAGRRLPCLRGRDRNTRAGNLLSGPDRSSQHGG